ncbi:MAG TPA: hypothetical protein VLT90_12845 [Terriglobales bacterium]|nr:hypothetical protein [Terriglobales bacterium]
MRVMNLKFVKFAVYVVLVVGLSVGAFAGCGDTLSVMAATAASIRTQSGTAQSVARPQTADRSYSSIVGLWHIRFVVGDTTIQEAYQLWNAGGTEVHNPNVDPRAGNVCLGVWKRMGDRVTYKLTHRVWNYDTNGNFGGTIHLSETITLGNHGTTHGGTFDLGFYGPDGSFLGDVPGNVIAERVEVE